MLVLMNEYSVRGIVALNLPSYGSGRNPWGKLKPKYLEKVLNPFTLWVVH